jgi:hypothetical protein
MPSKEPQERQTPTGSDAGFVTPEIVFAYNFGGANGDLTINGAMCHAFRTTPTNW